MSADVLREAAALMRTRAEAATGGGVTQENWWGVEGLTKVVTTYAKAKGHFIDNIEEDAEHIASWHPAVALVVADWLDAEANASVDIGATLDSALAVAHAYLGTTP